MSHKLQPVRGTHDILPEGIAKPDEATFEKFHAVISRARDLATLYGFKEMSTPIFEATEVFSRSMGETSDVVSKEMFTFETKGEDQVTLRPEFTAGIVRAFLSNGMQQHLPLKLFSTGPLFRYERPQKGRQRQFHQVNFEWIGDPSPEADVELIVLAGHLLYSLSGQKSKLMINTLGDKESRAQYREALVKFLTPRAKELSEDSQRRLISNPLRILDSKNPQDKKIIEGAPQITHYLNDAARRRFNIICESLCQEGSTLFQEPKITSSLVRGLDYYTDTVFEFVSDSGELGAQNTVLAGGRYDGLVEQMGGNPVPAIGFAAGVERLLLLTHEDKRADLENIKTKIMVLPLEGVESKRVLSLAFLLRTAIHMLLKKAPTKQCCVVEILWQGNLTKRLARAAQNDATHAIIFGPEEDSQGQCVIRNMKTRNETKMPVIELSKDHNLQKIFQMSL